MSKYGFLTSVVVCLAVVSPGTAAAAGPAGTPGTAAATGPQATVVGENDCLGCALKKAHGAAAQCAKYGHRHSLRVEKAVDASGQEIPNLKGHTLTYLENDKSEKLIKGEDFHAQRVEVQGKLYPQEGVIEVWEYRAP